MGRIPVKSIKSVNSIFKLLLLVPQVFVLCSCMVNGKVVMRPEDIIANVSGRTEDQVIATLETNFNAYKNAATVVNDYQSVIIAGKKAQSAFEDAFSLLGDKDGSWRSPVYVKKEGNQAPVVSDKTRTNLTRGYLALLHNMARWSLIVNDVNGYYSYMSRVVSPDSKLVYYNLLDSSLDGPEQLEFTLLHSMETSYRYFQEGHIDEAVAIAEILKLSLDRITKDNSRLWDVKGVSLGVTYRHFYNCLMYMLANYYAISGDYTKAEDMAKNLVTRSKDADLSVRAYMLMAIVKEHFNESYYAKAYVEKALGLLKENKNNTIPASFLASLPYDFIDKYLSGNSWLTEILDARYSDKTTSANDMPFGYSMFVNNNIDLVSAGIYRSFGKRDQMNQCLSRFENVFTLDTVLAVNDLAIYTNLLAREKDWNRIIGFVWPFIDAAEYYREIIANSKYASTAFSSASTLFANMALAVYTADGSRQVAAAMNNWPVSLGEKTSDKNEVVFKIIQLAKSRGILNTLVSKTAPKQSAKLSEEVKVFESNKMRLMQDTIYKTTLEQITKEILPHKKTVRAEWKNMKKSIMESDGGGLAKSEYKDVRLSANEVLLEYCVAADSILYYTIGDSALNVGVVNRSYEHIQKMILAYYEIAQNPFNHIADGNAKDSRGVSIKQRPSSGYVDEKTVAIELLQYLIHHAKIDTSKLTHLTISPDKAIGMLPFDVLLRQSSDPAMQKVDISYIPSATVLALLGDNFSKFSSDSLLLMGDPLPFITSGTDSTAQDSQSVNNIQVALRSIVVKSKNQPTTSASKDKTASPAPSLFERIPYTAVEIQRIDAVMKGKGFKTVSLLGSSLSKDNIRKGLAGKPRILHFATHGVMSNEIPYILNPTLLLSMAERPIDTFLQSSEIEKLDLSGTDLVVLSACKTGIDVTFDSEGVSGIAKSFMIAGAKNVLLTLWSIDDKATSAFIEQFYTGIANGLSVATALTNTRKQFIAATEYNQPYFWGGFALFGRGY